MEEEEARNWKEMEVDCLINIFQRLDLQDLILSLPFVCKSWSKASTDPLCFRILDIPSLTFFPWTSLAKQFSPLYSLSNFSLSSFIKYFVRRSCGSLVELRLPADFSPTVDDLARVSNTCQRLKVITLPKLMLEHEVHITELAAKWKELERLEMGSKPSPFTRLAARISTNCKKFRALKMAGSIKREDATAIAGCFKGIKELDLSRAYLPKEHLVVIVKGCKEIEKLILNECVGFDSGDEEIRKLVDGIKIFESRGSVVFDDYDFENDDCDPLNVCVM
ncbi:F-box/LRR-repeat protein At3g48880-like [Asparagus officinalis]|uniref:F-box/LRR-repeat protein At3g48880-like n=1 Tax=Asparagus officinalis TaxID=4686 RepID=UPI00098DF2D3|nr:F-box/LRR-repeat protein At3g48880-like [Asparagus officinalis]